MAANNDLLVRLVLQAVDQSLRSTLQGSAEDADRLGEAGDRASDRTDNLAGAMQGLASAAAALGLGALAAQLIEVADQYLRLEAQIKLAVGPHQDFKKSTEDVISVAMNTRVPLDAIGDLYAKMARNAKELGLDQAQMATITETVARTLVMQNASAQESDSVIRQLSQALASGVLRGDEFNSIMEQSPRLLQAVADGLGVQSGALRTLAEDGMLTADQITKALLKQSDAVQKESLAMPVTVSQALTTMTNAWEVYIGQANQKVGPATSIIAKGIEFVAHNLELLEVALGGVAAGGLVKLGQGLTGIVSRHQAAAAAAAQQTTAALANATATDRAAQAELGGAAISQRYALQQAATARAVLDHAIAHGLSAAAVTEAQAASVAANNAAAAAAQRMAAADAAAVAAKERLAAATVAANARTGLLTGAMGMLGGPAGVVMLAVTALGLLYTAFGKSQSGAEGLNKEIDEQIGKLNSLTNNQLVVLLRRQSELADEEGKAVYRAAQIVAGWEARKKSMSEYNATSERNESSLRAEQGITEKLEQAKADLDTKLGKLRETGEKMAQTQSRLNEVTGQGAAVADQGAKSYVAIAAELGRAELAAGNQTKAIEALTGAQEAWTEVAGRVAQALGTEAAQAEQAAAAAQQAAAAAAAVAAAKQQELMVAAQQLAALAAEQAAKANLTLADKNQRAESEANVIAKKAAAEQAAANAAALDLEAAALQGVVDAERAGAGAMNALSVAAEAARGRVAELTAARLAGKATQGEVNRAILEAVRAESAYQAALRERSAATDAALANAQRDRQLAEQTIQVKIDLLRAEQALALARGDEQRAAQIGIDIARQAAAQGEATVRGLQTEIQVMQEKLSLQQAAAAADGQMTDAERAALEAMQDALAAKQLEIESARAAIKERQAAIEAAKNETESLKENTGARQENAGAAGAETAATKTNTTAKDENTESTKRQTGAAGGFGAIINQVISSIYELSKVAGDKFLGISRDLSQVSDAAAEAARNLEIDKAAKQWNEFIILTGSSTMPLFDQWINKAIALKIAVSEQVIAAEQLRVRIEEGAAAGTLTMGELERATRQAADGFDLLDQERLDGLRSAVAAAKSQMDGLRDSVAGTLAGLRDEFDRLNGNMVAIEQRSFERQRAELTALLASTRDAATLADLRESLRLLDEIHAAKMRDLRDETASGDAYQRTAAGIYEVRTALDALNGADVEPIKRKFREINGEVGEVNAAIAVSVKQVGAFKEAIQ
jgi:tape measure domain-containing protein